MELPKQNFLHQFDTGSSLEGFQGCSEVLINLACVSEHQKNSLTLTDVAVQGWLFSSLG